MCTRRVALYVHDILRKFIFTSNIIACVFGHRKYEPVHVNEKVSIRSSKIFHSYEYTRMYAQHGLHRYFDPVEVIFVWINFRQIWYEEKFNITKGKRYISKILGGFNKFLQFRQRNCLYTYIWHIFLRL